MKKKVLLLHGALGSKKQFDALSTLLSAHVQVQLYNFPGHGGSVIPDIFNIDSFAECLVNFIEDKQLEGCSVFGYSMGGYVALKAAFNKESLFNKIITLGTKFDWSPEATAKEMQMLQPLKVEEKIPHFARMLESEHAPADWKELMIKTAALMKDLSDGTCLKEEDLNKITVPTLITVGDQDSMVSIKESTWASTHLANARFMTLKDTTHPIQKVDPELLKDLILREIA